MEKRGSALVVVLAMVVLLTALTVAFFSRALLEQQISASSANQTKADLFAQGAIATIASELKQEIEIGSTGTVSEGVRLYRPKTFADAAPSRVSVSGIVAPNLVKMSVTGVGFYGNQASRAAVSTALPSLNGRAMSPARWNKPLLLPRKDETGTDFTPSDSVRSPDWILVSRDGDNPTAWGENLRSGAGSSEVVGRYAYMIYNEGGLLDANVAGSPSVSGSARLKWSRKGTVAFADLTVLPGLSNLGESRAQEVVNQIVGWRNYTEARAGGKFPALKLGDVNDYLDSVLGRKTRNLTVSGSLYNNHSDRMFTSRQQLIQFLTEGVANGNSEKAKLQTALQYLGTFSRSLNQPSYWPDPQRPRVLDVAMFSDIKSNAVGVDDEINPVFRAVPVTDAMTVSGSTRNDGSKFVAGEPLVKKRFALSRLLWLTYKGPSAEVTDSELFQAYLDTGMSRDELQRLWRQGTRENIEKYFGLRWMPPAGRVGGYWLYVHGYNGGDGNTIASLDVVRDSRREANFFELLQAAICAGSLGVARNVGGAAGDISSEDGYSAYQARKLDSRVDFQVLQIGANIIDQAQPENYPTLIVFREGGSGDYVRPFWGTVDLPYLVCLTRTRVMAKTPAVMPVPENFGMEMVDYSKVQNEPKNPYYNTYVNTGTMVLMEVPVVWNMHRKTDRNLLAPGRLRANVSNATIARPSSNPPPANMHSARVSGVIDNSGGNNRTVENREGYAEAPWSNGYVEPNTGMVMARDPNGVNVNVYFPNVMSLYREPTPLLRSSGSLTLSFDDKNALVSASADWKYGVCEAEENAQPNTTGTMALFGCLFAIHPARMVNSNASTWVGNTAPAYSMDFMHFYGVEETISLEYENPDGTWMPYRQYLHRMNFSGAYTAVLRGSYVASKLSGNAGASASSTLEILGINGNMSYRGVMKTNPYYDPRTARWTSAKDWSALPLLSKNIDESRTMMETFRPGTADGGNVFSAWIGMSTQNLSGKNGTYTDPDGVVRRAMGAYVAANPNSTVGLPMATVLGSETVNGYNRPLMLNRPYRSVAELGAVYRETPWRNIDFFTPESGDVALLDVFCVDDDERGDALEAGRVDLNTRNEPVLQAILKGAYRDEITANAAADSDTKLLNDALSKDEAKNLAERLVAYTNGNSSGQGPLSNVAELVGRWNGGAVSDSINGATAYSGFTTELGNYLSGPSPANNLVQGLRETVIRALADTGQAGVWNLLIDVVAQTGRYPSNASNVGNFMVEGERRYWVHLAIDRQTGKIIDQQIEAVSE